jgi:hypothetical protein
MASMRRYDNNKLLIIVYLRRHTENHMGNVGDGHTVSITSRDLLDVISP